MSRNSKARRAARKKKQPTVRRKSAAVPVEPHATVQDENGHIQVGAGRRGKEWVIVFEGKVVAGTDSAAMLMAMLRHIASVRESNGSSVRLAYSTTLRAAATLEAQQEGKSLDEFLAILETERAERIGNNEPGTEGESEQNDEALLTHAPDEPV